MGNKFVCQNKWSYLSALKEIYIDECYQISEKLQIDSILDVGANLGFSIAYFKKQFPDCRITAIEADPKIFNFLERNIKNNNFNRVTLLNGAAWTQDGEMDFFQDHSQGGSLHKSNIHVEATKIKTYDLKKIIDSSSNWDLLKIDVEGAEVELLTHIQNELKIFKAVFIEYHEHKEKSGQLSQLLKILEENGFKYSLSPIFGSQNILKEYFSNNAFDLQLNIHAVKMNYLKD